MAHNHSHRHSSKTPERERRLLWALWLIAGFMLVEVAGGLISGSLALLADAAHMATDAAALLLAWLAFRLSRRPADAARSFGFHRAEILAAFVNGVAMMALVVWILYEAVNRMLAPVEIMGGVMLAVAFVGFLVNLIAFWLLHSGAQENLNLRGATLHVLGDLLGSVAAIVAAIVILLTGWTPIDPILSLVVAALILRSAWSITRQSAHILMEGAPAYFDLDQLGTELCERVEGVENIHHMHAWSLTQERPMITFHAQIADDADGDRVIRDLNQYLRETVGVRHATIQIERTHCKLNPNENESDGHSNH